MTPSGAQVPGLQANGVTRSRARARCTARPDYPLSSGVAPRARLNNQPAEPAAGIVDAKKKTGLIVPTRRTPIRHSQNGATLTHVRTPLWYNGPSSDVITGRQSYTCTRPTYAPECWTSGHTHSDGRIPPRWTITKQVTVVGWRRGVAGARSNTGACAEHLANPVNPVVITDT